MKLGIKMILACSFIGGAIFLVMEGQPSFASSTRMHGSTTGSDSSADLRDHRCRQCQTDCDCTQCPCCQLDICQLEIDRSPIKKSCFTVEQKTICIPPIRFPWMKCCPPGSAKTRTVCQLKKHAYECPHCKYTWKLIPCNESSPTPATAKPSPTLAPKPPTLSGIAINPPNWLPPIQSR